MNRSLAVCLLTLLLAPFASAAPTTRPAEEPMDVRCRALADRWKARIAEQKMNVVVSSPYVIAGDSDPARLARYRDGTILAATRALQAQYFKARPAEPIFILLLETADSYNRICKDWYNEAAISPFGFYRPSDRTLIMNVGTGTGTLVHELAHALIAPDFPNVPDWFNEGLASLYEQCSIDGDTITGHPNWRLPKLQKAIRDGTLRPLSEMIEDKDFRNDDRVGINYAQARYLMFFLQQKKLLTKYYAAARDRHKDDPTGLETLNKTIAPQKLEAFDKDYRAWVLTLQFGD